MIRSIPGRTPRVDPTAWVDEAAQVIGDVIIEAGASVWPTAVLRGDEDNYVRLGRNSNVQDGAVIEERAQVAAGALVPPGKVVPAGWLVMGVPAKPVRKMSQEELEDIERNARDYFELWHRDYKK